MPDGRVLAQGEIERQIMELSDELGEETDRYAVVEEEEANREADYKLAYARALISIAASVTDRRTSAGEREALANSTTNDAFRIWKIADARRQASKQALLSLRSRLDALRTLSANVRAQT